MLLVYIYKRERKSKMVKEWLTVQPNANLKPLVTVKMLRETTSPYFKTDMGTHLGSMFIEHEWKCFCLLQHIQYFSTDRNFPQPKFRSRFYGIWSLYTLGILRERMYNYKYEVGYCFWRDLYLRFISFMITASVFSRFLLHLQAFAD